MRYPPPRRGGDGEERGPFDIDWSNVDLTSFGRRRGGRPPSGLIVILTVVAVVFLLVPFFVGPLIGFLTDLLWFRSLGLESVYLVRYTAGFWAFVWSFLAFFLFAAVNLYFALRPRLRRAVVEAGARPGSALALTLRLLPILLIPSFFFGLAGSGQWDTILRWQNGASFASTDPIFGRDIGFYFFTLPFLQFVRGWLIVAVILTAAGVAFVYSARGVAGVALGQIATPADLREAGNLARSFAIPARAHLSILAGLFLFLLAGGYVIDQFGLLFRQESVLTGAGYTSVNARLPGLTILTVIVGLAGLLALANAFARTIWLLVGALGVWLLASVVLLGVYPGVVQTFFVNPDPINHERPYLERHIQATRAAYGLANIDESNVDVGTTPKPEDLQAFSADSSTVRLWDWHQLLDAYQQLQALRQYYVFNDVDVDRYQIRGAERPTMIAARELDVGRLPNEARTWQNNHLVYTHGFGAVLTAVNGVTPEGLPRLELRDIPPQGEPKITEPRIYYGEITSNYVIVGTTQDEFDGADQSARFGGGGGIGIGSIWDRLLFAARFGDGNLLFTPQLGAQSRVLFHRDIAERARLIAPFLAFDHDPYLVVADGKLYWIHDAYTTGNGYPYSQFRGAANYIRNSVKVVTDAYDGSMTFYVVDPTDPVVATLRRIYPDLFKHDVADMPATLRAHLRYPEDLFRLQVDVFSTFHMTDPQEFYNRGDAWKIANEILTQGGPRQAIDPYYVTVTLPGSSHAEFLLFVPMTPAGNDRDNMVAWMAGRADAPDYGKLRVLRFPRDRLIFGPLQIENRIDNDSSIRQQLTLLSSGAGASVVRGNLLVLPSGGSFLYIEPLYVQASQGRIPELRRVILATQERVVMEDTFEKALSRLFTETVAGTPPSPTVAPGASPRPGATPTAAATVVATAVPGSPRPTTSPASTTVAQLVRDASDQFDAAQAALRNGDFAEYGRRIAQLQDTLAKLRAATGQ
jgi:hypothetical protein